MLVDGKSAARGGDRSDLHLPPGDVQLIERALSLNPWTVVVLIGGGTIMTDPWDAKIGALLHAWYPGMEGGRAIADILLGDVDPSGRLPLAIPARREHLPMVDWTARHVTYPRWFGQQKLDRDGVQAAYPLGYGLSYASFAMSDAQVCQAAAGEDSTAFAVEVTVRNTGARTGRHVVQVYATQDSDPRLPFRALVGFAPVLLDGGAEERIKIPCSLAPVRRWDAGAFGFPHGALRLQVSSWAGDPDAVLTELACDRARGCAAPQR